MKIQKVDFLLSDMGYAALREAQAYRRAAELAKFYKTPLALRNELRRSMRDAAREAVRLARRDKSRAAA